MGWQDEPLVDDVLPVQDPAWMSAPLVETPVRSRGLRRQPEVIQPPTQEPELPVPPQAPPPQTEQATPQPRRQQVRFEGKIYEFEPTWSKESIGRWMTKNLMAERRGQTKLAPEQAGGRSKWTDPEPHAQQRQQSELGQQGRTEYATTLKWQDAEGKPVQMKPEEFTPGVLAKTIEDRKKYAAEMKDKANPVALRDYENDTAMMERDLGRLWDNETTAEYKKRMGWEDTSPTPSASTRDAAIEKARKGATEQTPPKELGWGESLSARRLWGDVPVTALKSAVALPQAATGLVDVLSSASPFDPVSGFVRNAVSERTGIPANGWFGWMQEKLGIRYEDAQKMLNEAYSPEQQRANAAVSDAKGVIAKAGAALRNPSVIANTVTESIPQMLAGGAIGKALGLAPKIGKFGYAIGEGLLSAGSGAEQTRAQSPTGSLTGGQVALHAASGALTGVIGVLGGKVASRLGVDDIDKLVAGNVSKEVKQTIVARALARALASENALQKAGGKAAQGVIGGTLEGTEEFAQSAEEQILGNLARGKPWQEGLDEAVVMGALSGGVMGAGAQGLGGLQRRLAELRDKSSKGFVSEQDAKDLGLPPEDSANRKTRRAAVEREISDIEQEIQNAFSAGTTDEGGAGLGGVPGEPSVPVQAGTTGQVDAGTQADEELVPFDPADEGAVPPGTAEPTTPPAPEVPPGGGEVAADVEGAIDEDVQTAIGRLSEAITTLDPEQQQKAIDDWTPVVDAASRGDEAATETILKMYGEVEDASAVRSTEGEVRQVEGGQDIRGTGKEQVPAEPAGEVAPARPEAEAEVPVTPTVPVKLAEPSSGKKSWASEDQGYQQARQSEQDESDWNDWLGSPERKAAIESSTRLQALEKKTAALDEEWANAPENAESDATPPYSDFHRKADHAIIRAIEDAGGSIPDGVKRFTGYVRREKSLGEPVKRTKPSTAVTTQKPADQTKESWQMTLPEYEKQVAGERVTEVASRTNTGRVIRGLGIHADALQRLNTGESIADEGFITSKGRYVSRVEAAMLTGGDYWREVAEGRQEGAAEGVMAEPEEGRKPVQAAEFHRWSVERSKAPPATQQAVDGKIKGLKPKPATAPVAKAGPTSAEGVPSTVGGTQNEPGQGQQAAPAAESGGRGPGRSNRPPLRDLGSPGKRGRLNTASGKVFDVEYVAVEADDLIPSHDARRNFAKNEGSNPNERPYHDPKEGMSSRLTVQQIAEARDDKINLLVSDNESPTDGPPMVVEDGRVLGGNARTQGIQLGYFNGGEPAAKFKQLAVDNAAKFKLNPDAVASMKQPVIVRVLEGITDLGEMSRLLNKPLTAGKSASTEAVSVGSRISQGTAELVTSMLEPRGEEGAPSLREVLADTRKSSNLVKLLHADGAWTQDDIDKYVNPHTGDLNDAGKLQIEEALLGRIIADPKIVGGMSPGERRMVLSSLSPLSRIALHPKHGQRAGEIIKAAVEAFPSYKAANTPIRQYFMQQTSMMEMPGQGDESVAAIVNAMDTMGTRGFKNGLEDVLDSLGIKTKQKGLFPSEIKKTETIDEAIAEVFPLPLPAKKKGPKEPSSPPAINAPPSTPKAEPKASEQQGDLSPEDFADVFANPEPAPAPPVEQKPPAKSTGKKRSEKPRSSSKPSKGERKSPKEGVAEGLAEAKAGADLILKGLNDLGTTLPSGVPINSDIARGMGMVANGLIKAGKYKFQEFIEEAAKLIGKPAVKYLGKHLEAGWNRKAESDSRLDKASSVEQLLAEPSKEPSPKQTKPSEPETDTDKALRQAGLNVEKLHDGMWQITGNTYEHSKEIGDVKREQPDLGGWWHRDTKRWTFKRDPRRAIADRIAGAGTTEESGDARSRSEQVAREEARRREDERPDVQRTGGTYAASVDSSTKDLIARGLKHSITQEVVDSQIEDIGRVVDAAENERPMFVIGSAPGTGKTFVLGGVIRELRNRGFKKFVYVTQNQNLISQVKDNLADYGLEGVEFTTYSKARETPPNTSGSVLLLDEAHSAKNTDRETGKSVSRMVSGARFTVYATATPFENVTEAEYLGYSGIFDGLHVEFDRPSKRPGKPFHNTLDGFDAWAWMFGANVYFIKKTDRSGREYLVPVVWWDKHQTAEADQFAANEWMKKRGVYVQHPMSLPPEAVNSEMRAVDADPYWADISNEVVQIYADAEAEAESDIEKGQINAHKVNVLKRLLETAKVDAAIARAKEIIGDGKKDDPQAIIFVNTKQDLNLGSFTLSEPYRKHHSIKGAEAKRRYKPAEMDRMMQQWYEAREAAEMMGDGRASVGPPPFAPFIHKIAMAMDRADVLKKFPSVIDKIMDAFPGQAVEFSGRMTEAQNAANLAKWKANEAKLIVATMDKGGTGLSFHDTTGTMPSRYQVNMNLPWSGTKVEQVGGRLARYGTAKPVTLEWIFANNIPFDRELSKTVGSRMRSMSAAVQGRKSGAAKQIREFDFEADAPTEEITREQRVKEIQERGKAWYEQTHEKPSPEPKTKGRKKSAAQAKAEQANKEVGAAVDAVIKAVKNAPSSPGALGLNAELITSVGELMKATVRAGYYNFAAFIERVVEKYGRQFALDHAAWLRDRWDAVSAKVPGRLDASSDVAELLAEKPEEEDLVEVEPAEPEDVTRDADLAKMEAFAESLRGKPAEENAVEPEGDTTGTKNVKTDEMREKAGLGERVMPDRESVEDWRAEAARRMEADPTLARRMAEELAENPDKVDNPKLAEAIMGRYIRDLENRRQAGEDVQDELLTAVLADERVGTEWSRWGVSRQVELAADFSVAGIVRQHLRSVNEKPTAEQMAKYEELADKLKAAEAELEVLKEKAAKAAFSEAVEENKKPREKPKSTGRLDAAKERAKKAAANVKEKFKALFALGVAADPTMRNERAFLSAVVEAIRAYADLIRVQTFTGFRAWLKSETGMDVDKADTLLRKAWDQELGEGTVATPEVDAENREEVSKLAKQILREVVESGITETDAAIDAVHAELQSIIPDITREEARDAASGYGTYRRLPMDEVSQIVRRIKGESQQTAKLETLQRGIARAKELLAQGKTQDEVAAILEKEGLYPKSTGIERREVKDVEAQLIKEVNRLKKEMPVTAKDKAGRLKSALGAAKTAARNRIRDLGVEIAALEKSLASKTPLQKPIGTTPLIPDADLETAREQVAQRRQERDALKADYEKLFPTPKKPATEAQRIAAAIRALDRVIAQMEADNAAGRLGGKSTGTPLESPELTARRERLQELRDKREDLRENDPAYQAEEEVKRTARYKRSLDKRLEFWQKRLDDAKRGKLPEKRQVKTPVNDEILEQKYQIELVKRHARAEIEEAERSARGRLGKALGFGGDLLDLARSLQTGFESSAVLAQGAIYTMGFPRQAFPTIARALEAAFSRRADFALHDNLMQRPNHRDYVTGNMETTADDGPLSHREELLRSRIASWLAQTEGWKWAVPRWAAEGLLGSERAFRSFCNTMRADLFDYMKSSVEASRPGTWSDDDTKILGSASNVFSGRAAIRNSVGWSRVFYAPRWLWSGALTLVGQPAWKGDSATRLAVGKVYVRGALGAAAFFIIRHFLYSLAAGDDEDKKPKYEWNTIASDFTKQRLGETRLDMSRGLSQLVTLGAREITGYTKTSSGKIVPIRGENVPPNASDARDILHRFLDTKLAPLPSAVLDFMAGESVVGEKATVWTIVGSRVTPMTWRDIWEAEKELNVPQGTVAAIDAFFGLRMSTYGPRTKYRNASPEERKKQFENDLERMKWDSGPPAYAEMLTADQMKQVDARREEKKRSVIEGATASPPDRKKHKTDKSYADSVKQHEKALETFRAMAATVSFEQAVQLLRDYYRYQKVDAAGRPRGSYIDTDSKYGESKDEYSKRLKFLRKLYGK